MDPVFNIFTDIGQTAMQQYHQLGVAYLIFVPLAVLLTCVSIMFLVVRYRRRGVIRDLERLDKELSSKREASIVEEETLALPPDVAEVRALDHSNWLKRLQVGLTKSRESLTLNLSRALTGKTKIDDDVLETLHEQLYRADIGVKTVDRLVDGVRTNLQNSERGDMTAIVDCLRSQVVDIFSKNEKPLNIPVNGPWVILIVGVNGVGKTTTIGKLAAHFLASGKTVLLAAADTYRAAAIDQLKVWGKRLNIDVIAHKEGSDPAAVAYDGVKAAMARSTDVLLIDTAGRLHSKTELMDELAKIKRVIGRDLPEAPHEIWLVIDATTGQNAFMQTQAFKDVVDLTGTIITKLDGTAKGGVVIGVSDQFGFPIRYVGVGEKAADLRTFSALDYANSLL